MSQTTTTTDPLSVLGKETKAVFNGPLKLMMTARIGLPSNFLKRFWSRYPQGQPGLNGNVFEAIIAVLLFRQNLTPLYVGAHIAFVPNVIFDSVLYTKEYGPIVLSMKTSLRERYKQADLEGMALRNVHRKAKTYLITANAEEAKRVNKKIRDGDVLGIEQVVFAFGRDMDNLIIFLQGLTLQLPGTKDIMTAPKIIG